MGVLSFHMQLVDLYAPLSSSVYAYNLLPILPIQIKRNVYVMHETISLSKSI